MERYICKICKNGFKSSLSLSKHINNFHKISKKEYCLEYDCEGIHPRCKCGCGQQTNFTRGKFSNYINGHIPITKKTLEKRFKTNLKKYGYKTPAKNDKIKKKTKDYFVKKFGVKNPFQSEEIKNKIKQQNLKEYGIEYNWQRDDVKEKIKQIKLKKYENENYVNIEKSKQTCLKKYGVENPFQSEDIKKKIRQTNLEKYGVEYPSQQEYIIDKIKNTNLNKYGVENPFQSNEIRKKIKNTNNKKYGVDNPTECLSIKQKIRRSALKTFFNKLKKSNRLNNKIIPLFVEDEYTGVKLNQRYKFQCKICNNIFYDRLDDGHIPICRNCEPINYQQSQNDILEYIKSIYEGKILNNTRIIIYPQELDIYIPDKKIAIEYNGLYWHSNVILGDKNYHLNKTTECEKKGIQLIHIFEDEWVNKKDIVKNRLKHLLGLSSKKVYARKCKTRELFNEEKNIFLNQYHIQGSDNSGIRLGLFYDGELVAVMTFGKRRVALGKKQTDENEYELLRYATSQTVVGGAGKLLNYFIKNYKPVKIISYADRRWSQGILYEKIGFNKTGETPINYWYFKNGYIERIHRFNFRKNVLNEKLETFDDKLTEWQNMQLNGYDRIWDCGSLKYEMIIN